MDRRPLSSVTADGVELAGQCWQPEGEVRAVICLVHGLGEHTGRYAQVAAAFTEAGYVLFGYDLRGHGKSGGQRGHTPTFEALLDDVDRLLEEASTRYPGKPRFLYGHSLGGGIVLAYVLRRKPDLAGVIATGPSLRLVYPPSAPVLLLWRLMDRIRPNFAQPNGLDQALSRDPQVVRDYRDDPLVHDRITARLAVGMFDAGEWSVEHAAELAVPLLLMHGGADALTSPLGSAAFEARAGHHCMYRQWDGLYHEIHNEPEKREVVEAMKTWLSRRAAEPLR